MMTEATPLHQTTLSGKGEAARAEQIKTGLWKQKKVGQWRRMLGQKVKRYGKCLKKKPQGLHCMFFFCIVFYYTLHN